jgi:hypothetical protein
MEHRRSGADDLFSQALPGHVSSLRDPLTYDGQANNMTGHLDFQDDWSYS